MEQNQQFKRQVAVKLWISNLVNGQYIKEEGLRPNYVILKDGRKIHRVNVLGAVVSVNADAGYSNVYLDDGTARLSVRSFEQNKSLDALGLGSIVFVIGKPREYGREIYVLPEIIKPVIDKKWIDVRRLELEKQKIVLDAVPEEAPKVIALAEESADVDGSSQKMLDAVRLLDLGAGADYDAALSKSGLQDAEKVILKLMKNGEIFEVSPGKLKVLE